MAGTDESELGGDVSERAVSFVVIEPAVAIVDRDEEVEPAVVVVVTPGRAFGDLLDDDAGRFGDVLERAVALVVVEAAQIDRGRDCRDGYSPQTKRSSRPSWS